MPRLPGHRDKHPFDFYDSFDPTTIERTKPNCWINLFGIANVGTPNRSNVQVAGFLACDQTSVVMNVYARTNIPKTTVEATDALVQASHAALVTLYVGQKPLRTFSLSALLQRKPFDKTAYNTVDDTIRQQDLDGTAAELCAAFHERTDVKGSWEERDDAQRNRWREVANTARFQIMGPNRPIIVPVRQNVTVRVDLEPHSLSKLSELVPKGIAPRPLIWIHLDGIAVRDVC